MIEHQVMRGNAFQLFTAMMRFRVIADIALRFNICRNKIDLT